MGNEPTYPETGIDETVELPADPETDDRNADDLEDGPKTPATEPDID